MKKIKKMLLCMGLVAAVLLAEGEAFATEEAPYTIQTMAIKVYVKKNGLYQVTEKLKVRYDKPWMGVTKLFHTRLTYGPETYNPVYRDIAVEGGPRRIDELSRDYLVRMRVGDIYKKEDGVKTYTIGYQVDMGEEGGKKAFFYPVMEDTWETEIENLKVDVEFEKSVKTEKAEALVDQTPLHITQKENGFSFTAKNISPQESVYMHMPVPKGYFKKTISENFLSALALMLISLAFALGAGFRLHLRKSRIRGSERNKGPFYYPAAGLTPPEMAYILKGHVDRKDAAALGVYLAEGGYLRGEKTETGIGFRRDVPLPENAPAYMKHYFEGADMEQVIEGVPDVFTKAKALKDAGIRKKNRILGFLTCLVGGLGIYSTGIKVMRNDLIAPVGFFAVTFLFTELLGRKKNVKKVRYIYQAFLAAALIVLPGKCLFPHVVQSLVLTTGIGTLLYMAMPEMSDYGIEKQGEIRALRRSLAQMTKEQGKNLLRENPSYYYRMLPFADLLGAEESLKDMYSGMPLRSPLWFADEEKPEIRADRYMQMMRNIEDSKILED